MLLLLLLLAPDMRWVPKPYRCAAGWTLVGIEAWPLPTDAIIVSRLAGMPGAAAPVDDAGRAIALWASQMRQPLPGARPRPSRTGMAAIVARVLRFLHTSDRTGTLTTCGQR